MQSQLFYTLLVTICVLAALGFTPSPTKSPCDGNIIYSRLSYDLISTKNAEKSVNEAFVKNGEGTVDSSASGTCYGFKLINAINDGQSYYFKFYYGSTTLATTSLLKYGEPAFVYSTLSYSTWYLSACTEKDVCTVLSQHLTYPTAGADRYNYLVVIYLTSGSTPTYDFVHYYYGAYSSNSPVIGFINFGSNSYYEDGLFETYNNKTTFLANSGASSAVTGSYGETINLATQTQLVCQTETPSALMCPFKPLKWLGGGFNVTAGYVYFIVNLDGYLVQIYNA
jgi:hypothetical protein